MADCFRELISDRSANPQEDLVSQLVQARAEGKFERERENSVSRVDVLAAQLATLCRDSGQAMGGAIEAQQLLDRHGCDRGIVAYQPILVGVSQQVIESVRDQISGRFVPGEK